MAEIMMQMAGYKPEKNDKNQAVPCCGPGDEEKMRYATIYGDDRELPGIGELEQDGMYEVRALVRVESKSSDEKDSGKRTDVRLEVHKIGFAKAAGKKNVETMSEAELNDDETAPEEEGKKEY